MSDREWITVGRVDDFVQNRAKEARAGDMRVLVVRVENRFLAVINQCSHQGAALHRGVTRVAGSVRTVTCPAHGSVFSLDDGHVMRPPASAPIQAFETRVVNEEVQVCVNSQP